MGGVTTTQSVRTYGQCDARFSPNSGFGLMLGDVLSATETCQDSLSKSQYLFPAQSLVALRYIRASKDSSKRFSLECKWGHPVWTEPKTVKIYKRT